MEKKGLKYKRPCEPLANVEACEKEWSELLRQK